ncbi:hypothetical protein AXX17_AT3G09830 [Arabidopsis thaliana]|uniref:Uncharacterized protein n=1 Tax=Arabidopsis thaliana TaxID=3702 RepID=A0A178VNV3_ARATH|nr:hypothetical protein AXX17_AT3G09830 [Arabidopsis thaliana]
MIYLSTDRPKVSFLKKPTSPRSELSIRSYHHFSALDTISLTNPQLSEQPTSESNSKRPRKRQDTIYATTESFEFYRDLSHLYRDRPHPIPSCLLSVITVSMKHMTHVKSQIRTVGATGLESKLPTIQKTSRGYLNIIMKL